MSSAVQFLCGKPDEIEKALKQIQGAQLREMKRPSDAVPSAPKGRVISDR
jgi:hypothetical protein